MGAWGQGGLASPTMTAPLARPTTSLSGGVGVAAHSPATAAAGMALLDAGGTAADAAVGMTLAACAVEPFVVSLLSGLHGIHVDVDGTTRAVDGFVDVPAVPTGGRRAETTIDFGGARMPYSIGGATFGTPGLVAGCWHLHRRFGRLPWAEVVAPAIEWAGTGFVLSDRDESLLHMLEPVMTLGVGREVFCIDDRMRVEGELVRIPDLADALRQIAEEGGPTLYEGAMSRELATFAQEVGALVTAEDLGACTAVEHTPPTVRLGGWQVRSRRGLSPLTDWVARLDASDGPHAARLALAQSPTPPKALGTTSLAATDTDGRACAVTASLGLGTGDWFRGSQLNSMLGEVDLLVGGLRPRTRMGSMMAPTAVVSPTGQATVLGAAGGSRIPSALLRTIDGIVLGELDATAAVDLPRIHRVGELVHVEPHLEDRDEAALVAAGFTVQRWTSRHHFFGGVSVAGAAGTQGDPRRGGVGLAHR